METIIINNKEVDLSTIEIDGIDLKDRPDFCDAYICSAQFIDGEELNDDELDVLKDEVEGDWYEMIQDTIN